MRSLVLEFGKHGSTHYSEAFPNRTLHWICHLVAVLTDEAPLRQPIDRFRG